jgi:hypothetical protein
LNHLSGQLLVVVLLTGLFAGEYFGSLFVPLRQFNVFEAIEIANNSVSYQGPTLNGPEGWWDVLRVKAVLQCCLGQRFWPKQLLIQ